MEFIKEYPIEKLKVWEMNPRKNDEASEKLSEMIQEYGFVNPIIIDQNGVIRAGHTRLKAAKKLKRAHVPVLIYDFENEAQAIGYAIADNKVGEIADWDFEKLDVLMKELEESDFDTLMTGFDDEEIKEMYNEFDNKDDDNLYTTAIKIPQYEIKGEKPTEEELISEEKTNNFIEEIMAAEIFDEEKNFLIKGAYRHLVFDYGKIAEYYAHASPEVQRLMEKSAMVIIDLNDAIANGYTKLSATLEQLKEKDDKYEG